MQGIFLGITTLGFSSVQLLSSVRLCDTMNRSTPGLPVYRQLPEFTELISIESVMPSNHLILCHPLLLLPSQSFPASGSFQMSQLFASVGQSISFSFNISPSYVNPGLITFRMDWLDLLAVQRSAGGTRPGTGGPEGLHHPLVPGPHSPSHLRSM